jgi:hypothetical protein
MNIVKPTLRIGAIVLGLLASWKIYDNFKQKNK